MSSNNLNKVLVEDEINIIALFQLAWKAKYFSLLGGVFFLLVFSLYAYFSEDVYYSEATFIANSELSPGQPKSLGGLGGLASLAGINVSSGDNKLQLALQVARSKSFTKKFLESNEYDAKIYTSTSWDSETNTLYFDEQRYDTKNKKWQSDNGKSLKPKNVELYNAFHKQLLINYDPEKSTIKIGFSHYSPYLAKEIVQSFVHALNESMRERDRKLATKSIEYLSRELEATTISNVEKVITSLIEEKAKSLMFTNVHEQYVLMSLDPPELPEKASRPNRILISIFGFFVGAVVFLIVKLCLLQSNGSRK